MKRPQRDRYAARRTPTIRTAALCGVLLGGAVLAAEPAPPSYQVSPDIFRVVALTARARVIEQTLQPGQADRLHSQAAGAMYAVTDCQLERDAFGVKSQRFHVAGSGEMTPPFDAVVMRNAGPQPCRIVRFEVLAADVPAGPPLSAPPSYKASPDVYRLVTRNDRWQLIEARFQPGQVDQQHSHGASVSYMVSDCTLEIDDHGMKFYRNLPAGTGGPQAAIDAHVVRNAGSTACRLLMLEEVADVAP